MASPVVQALLGGKGYNGRVNNQGIRIPVDERQSWTDFFLGQMGPAGDSMRVDDAFDAWADMSPERRETMPRGNVSLSSEDQMHLQQYLVDALNQNPGAQIGQLFDSWADRRVADTQGRINRDGPAISPLRQRLMEQDAQLGQGGLPPSLREMSAALRRSPDLMQAGASDFFNGIGVRSGEADVLGQIDQMDPQERESFYRFAMRELGEGYNADAPLAGVLGGWQNADGEYRDMVAEDMQGMAFERQPRAAVVDALKGGRTYNQGAPITDRDALLEADLNATEGRMTGFATTMMQSEPVIREMAEQGIPFGQRMIEAIPGNSALENWLHSDEYRRYRVARDSFLEAALRYRTGATINSDEIPRIDGSLMPNFGDDPSTTLEREMQREALMQAVLAGSGDGAALLPEVGEAPVQRTGTGGATHRFNPATGQIEAIQ